ncbi:hypothetical protein EIN_443050 [Entamoeba invadens IP1]|uniref:Leucine rich repeat containing protein BspA family protein n=1 Tax=Entamoeba invadens IP1 TaxID=370355 RepID=A0A0A1UB84_ENTIV|nr:hypothetical protein EIN_443050 [Entamoeba invadens IP1]ELP92375.1 hypothetical protein EIN_443050 [Entamoeba invadens IP1]|eukprot:XP_004259146.1 hypothetical protein EIN_443050 [Entamoeba invadens IP1]
MSRLYSYHLMIISKYFKTIEDFIHLEFVSKKFEDNMAKFHYNPIPLTIKTRKYFPHLQTICLYSVEDEIFDDDEVFSRSVEFVVSTSVALQNRNANITYKNVHFTEKDSEKYVDIPHNAHIKVVEKVPNSPVPTFSSSQLKHIIIPEGVTEITNRAFPTNYDGTISLPKSLIKLGKETLHYIEVTTLTLPTNLLFIGNNCFNGAALEKIEIPESVISLGDNCFKHCEDLEEVILSQRFLNDKKRLGLGKFTTQAINNDRVTLTRKVLHYE